MYPNIRRFRLTHLRKARVSEDILRWWMGHSSKDISDRYSKLAEDLEFRKHWAKAAGLGFDVQWLGHPKRERKRRTRVERMLRNQSVPTSSYRAADGDLPGILFAKEACVGA